MLSAVTKGAAAVALRGASKKCMERYKIGGVVTDEAS